MSKPRKRPSTGFLALIVEPVGDFDPHNWQPTPEAYRILQCAGWMTFRGQADAWRFLHNQTALKQESPSRWAILIPVSSKADLDRTLDQMRDSPPASYDRKGLASGPDSSSSFESRPRRLGDWKIGDARQRRDQLSVSEMSRVAQSNGVR